MVCKASNNQAPEYLSVLFNRVSAMTGKTIRNANINLRPPRLNNTLAHNFFAHRGALLWNNLQTEIKSAQSFESFKNRLKNNSKVISRSKSRLVVTCIYFFIPFVVNIAFLLL